MTGPLALNSHNAQAWAAVAFGTGWKQWGLSPTGTLEAENLRGPLIIWAKTAPLAPRPPRTEAPKPSPLAVRVFELNTAAHFQRFYKAARHKVRHSVRWKTGARWRKVHIEYIQDEITYMYFLAERRRRGVSGLVGRKACKIKSEAKTRSVKKYFAYLNNGKIQIRSAVFEAGFDYLEGRVITSEELQESGCFYKRVGSKFVFAHSYSPNLREAVSDLVHYLKNLRLSNAQLSIIVRFILERAAYLAHVRRTVKPSPRRGRVPRPVYARPRPPSAPLAPPVTC